jgi:hypothetical protein
MKNFPKRSVFVLALSLFISYGCKKDEAVVSVDACTANATLFSNAASVYGNSPTKANCEAYFASLNKYLDSCPGITTAQRAQYKADIAAAKCQ